MPHELDLSVRKGSYGCSRLGVLLDVDPFQDLHAWWAQEVGGLVVPPTLEQEAGKLFEEPILRLGSIKTGIGFRSGFNKTIRHPEYPKYHLIGTPDGLADDPQNGGAECKEVDPHRWRDFGSPYDLNPITPPAYELQCRGYMALTGRPVWRLIIHMGGKNVMVYVFERDIEFENYFLDRAERRHKRHFLDGERPPVGSNAITTEYLKWKYPNHKSPDLRPATSDEIDLVHEYGKLRAEYKALDKLVVERENLLREAVGDREGIVWPGGKFTWKKCRDGQYVDWQSMAIALRTAFIKDPDPVKQEEARKKVTDDHTRVRPGVRRIYYKYDGADADEETANAA